MKGISLFWVVVLTFIVVSCSLIEVPPVISLSVDPQNPAVSSDVTITLNFSPVVGNILAEIDINGIMVMSTNTVPAIYKWKPERVGNYIITGRVEGTSFDEEYEKSIVIEVRDNTPPTIESVDISPINPESDDDIRVILMVNEDTSYLTVRGYVDDAGAFTNSFPSPPYYIELEPLEPGTHILVLTVENSFGMKDSTKVSFYVFEKDDSPPVITLEFLTDPMENENVIAEISARDDTRLRDLRVSVDGSLVREFELDTSYFELPLNLGTLTVGNHTLEVYAEDIVGKETYFGRYFTVQRGSHYLRLIMKPDDPKPNDVVIFSYETNLDATDATFYVDDEIIAQHAENAVWIAKSGHHFALVKIVSSDGKTLWDGFSFVVSDDLPPKITSLLMNGIDVTKDPIVPLQGEYVHVRMTVEDETGLPKGGNVVAILSKSPMPNLDIQDFIILSQEEISYDTKIATYTGYVKMQPGEYFLIINDLKDSLDNSIKDFGSYYQYRIEVIR